MFTPNWQIPEKKFNPLRERFYFRNLNYDGNDEMHSSAATIPMEKV